MPCKHPKTAYYRFPLANGMGNHVTERCVECRANVRAKGGTNAAWVPHPEAREHAPGGDINRLPIDPFHAQAGGHPKQGSFDW
jgi:hypothetical protein